MAGLHEAGTLLLAHGKDAIWTHSQAVATEIKAIAGRYDLDSSVCTQAALCHDIGGIVPAKEMLAQAQAQSWQLDPAEVQHPFLLHQRFSRILCQEALGISDERILSAVACHSTLKANASPMDMALFLADKLAWDQPGSPPYEGAVREALAVSLAHACLVHIEYTMQHGMILMPHRWLREALVWLRHC